MIHHQWYSYIFIWYKIAPKITLLAASKPAKGLISKAPVKHSNSATQFKDPGTAIDAQEAKKNQILKEGIKDPKPL